MQIAEHPPNLQTIMNVVISPNIRKTSARIDPAGNIIDARTRQVIEPVQAVYVPPVDQPTTVEIPYIAPQAPTTNEISVIEQIRLAKENLARLEELKKLKIAEKEAELELLKQ